MKQGLVATGQTDHCLVNRHVSVRVQLHGSAHHIGTLGAGTGQQSHFVHGVKQFAVRGFQTVDLRDCTGYNHAHHVGHIVFFYGFGDDLRLYRCVFDFLCFFCRFCFFRHVNTVLTEFL